MTKAMSVLAIVAIGSALGVGAALCPDDCCPFAKAAGDSCCLGSAAMAQEAKPAGGCQGQTGASQEPKGGCQGHAGASQDAKSGCCASKAGQTAGQTAGCGAALASAQSQQCPKAALCKTALASMPKLVYRVGEQELCCPNGAEATAKETGKPIVFVVGSETFTNKSDATVKLTSALETFSTELLSVQFSAGGECFKCPVSAEEAARKVQTVVKYRSAGVDFDSKEKALQALEAAKKAAGEVKLVAFVGDKEYACCVEAGKVAKETGKEVTYVVGDQKTCCDVTAKLNLAQAKVNAIVDTAAQVSLGANTAAQAASGA